MATDINGVNLDTLNYTTLVPYNGTGQKGANALDFDVNLWYNVGHSPLRPNGPSTNASCTTGRRY